MARGDAWRRRLDRRYPTPEAKAAFDLEVRALAALAQIQDALQDLQKEVSVPKAEIARRLGKPRPNVSRWFGEDSNPTVVTLFELFAALGVGTDISWHPLREGEPLLRISFEDMDSAASEKVAEPAESVA